MQLFALPIAIILSLAVGYCWLHVLPPASMDINGAHPALIAFIPPFSLAVLVVVHELLHAIVHPRLGRTPATIIGLWPSRLLFFAHYSGPLTRNRFLLVFAMPFLVITILPLAVAATGILPSLLVFVTAWFSFWNAAFACGDCLGMALILFQIPRSAIVQNKGWRTYWKPV